MAQMISLDSLRKTSLAEMKAGDAPAAKPAAGGCSSTGGSSCGSSQGQGDLPPEIWEKVKDHPCYSEEAHHYFARMHVAVAPACNIQCNYCNRKYDCSNESRPGVVSEKLTPDQALRKVMAVAAKVPQLSVLGIAGPGDALANPHKTFKTFELVAKELPHIKLCLSTNGLALPDYVDVIRDFNVDHVTITINALDPEVGEKIYPWIFYDHKRWTGRAAAEKLIERQWQGLEMLTKAGILVKVNSVMIPGINDHHLLEVNKRAKELGAFLHNVMPLISDAAHGTHFGLTGQRGPSPLELKALQEDLDGGAKLMKHCRQCRADAVGLLGEDLGAEFTLDKIAEQPDDESPGYDPSVREAYLDVVARERADAAAAKEAAAASLAGFEGAPSKLVAVATKGGGRINQHFGHANEFQVYEVDAMGARFVGHRKLDDQYCLGGWGEDATLDGIIEALVGVDAVLCARIGHCPQDQLKAAGITASDAFAYEYIEPSILTWWTGAVSEEMSAGRMASA